MRSSLLGLVLLLGACGFEPLYGHRQSAGADAVDELKSVQIDIIPDRPGQKLRGLLETGFDPRREPGPDRYALAVRLQFERIDVAIRQDETATRQNLTVNASYALRSLADNKVLTAGQVRSINGFNVASSDYATRVAENDALDRAIQDLAVGIQTQVAIWFRRQNQTAKAP